MFRPIVGLTGREAVNGYNLFKLDGNHAQRIDFQRERGGWYDR